MFEKIVAGLIFIFSPYLIYLVCDSYIDSGILSKAVNNRYNYCKLLFIISFVVSFGLMQVYIDLANIFGK